VNRQDCEIILCEHETRRDKGRLFIELNDETRAQLRREIAERGIPAKLRSGTICGTIRASSH
jgi:hypothetical protein